MAGPVKGGSPIWGSYDVTPLFNESEKGKEAEVEGPVDLPSKPLPPIYQLSAEILVHIFKYVAGSDQPDDAKKLYAIQRVCTVWYRLSDDVLLMYWNKLCGSQVPLLHSFANSIERRIGSCDLSYFFRLQVLTENFKKMGVPIPADVPVLGLQPLQYVTAHQELLDVALKRIWDRMPSRINPGLIRATVLGAGEIRLWLNDPANAERIAQITHLDLGMLQLKILPPEIAHFTHLQSLWLQRNQLTHLPGAIGNLAQLQYLKLDHNQLTSLPRAIGNLDQMLGLHLIDNQLTGLPDTIGSLTQLEALSLSDNPLMIFPDIIGKFTRLKAIHLNSNELTSVSDAIGNLTELNDLYLGDNSLESLPDAIGNLTQLRCLYLRDNQLTFLPDTMDELTQMRVSVADGVNLYNNPLMFLLNKDLSQKTWSDWFSLPSREEIAARRLACSSYHCQSPLATLCQGIHRGIDNEALRQQFEALSPQMQQLIRDKWELTSFPSQSEGALFAKKGLFARAVIRALEEKFSRLSQEEKKSVYRRVEELAGYPSEDGIWGKEHAADNIIRLIDVMETLSTSTQP